MSWFTRLFKKKEPQKEDLNAFVRLDFTRTFPHMVWVSSVSYDRDDPNGFHYKMFATRHEPEMLIELLLLRQSENGTKKKVFHGQAPISSLSTTTDVIQELERSANVAFEQFDLSDVRTFEDLKSRALEVGWDAGHCE